MSQRPSDAPRTPAVSALPRRRRQHPAECVGSRRPQSTKNAPGADIGEGGVRSATGEASRNWPPCAAPASLRSRALCGPGRTLDPSGIGGDITVGQERQCFLQRRVRELGLGEQTGNSTLLTTRNHPQGLDADLRQNSRRGIARPHTRSPYSLLDPPPAAHQNRISRGKMCGHTFWPCNSSGI